MGLCLHHRISAVVSVCFVLLRFQPGVAAEPIAEARQLVRQLMAEQRIPGLSVAVWRENGFVWSEGFGFSDLETKVPVWPHTRFRIGSISKPIAAAALAKLYEEKRLHFDDPIWHHVPSFPQKQWPMTIRHVAGHLAGIRHYRGSEFLISRPYESVVDGLTIFQHDPLLQRPGEKYVYSSYGFNLLSAVIEKASGESFLDYVGSQVLRPLDMRQTIADRPGQIIANRTRFYERDGHDDWVNAPFVNNSYKWAGGGFLSTPEDLCRFAAGHLDGRFLGKETVNVLWTSQKTSGGEETGYGIGWRISEDDAERRRAGHSGGSVGGTSRLVVYPEQGVAVAVTTNLSRVEFDGLGYTIAELFLPPAR